MPGGASRTPDDTKSFALPHAPRGIDAATDFVSSGVRPSHAGCVAHRLARMREPDAAFADPRQPSPTRGKLPTDRARSLSFSPSAFRRPVGPRSRGEEA